MSDRYVPYEINSPKPGGILLVGRDPGDHEVEQGRPFVGLAGELLDSVLSETGFRRQDVNIANTVCWQPPGNDFKAHDPRQVALGVQQLHQLIDKLRPRLTITLGNEAAHALIDRWPNGRTQQPGSNIFGASGIHERRGYFWDTPNGCVLTTLHPAGVLRKAVPGRYLLGMDFRRGRRWLDGTLPRDAFPVQTIRLNSPFMVEKILQSQLVAWDIETKWDMTALLCSGFCGDDYQPYVALWGYEFDRYARPILAQDRVPLVGHNGPGFDVLAMRRFYNLHVPGYRHDTQQMWWALEPDLAGSGDTDEEDAELRPTRMTRKGLAFLASLYFNLPWWKDYPPPEDPDHVEKMVVLNGRDAFVTRWLADCMLAEMAQARVLAQYESAVALYPALGEMTLRGINVNESLRQGRLDSLKQRYESAQSESSRPGLQYIMQKAVPAFSHSRRCSCCGGGKVSRTACWRCAGFDKKPSKKAQGSTTLGPCVQCHGAGKITDYKFNPFSPVQMKQFLYEVIEAPKQVWNKKVTTDSTALKKILRWARGQ